MDGTRRSRRADAPPELADDEARVHVDDEALRDALAASLALALPEGGRAAVAYSGGPDSTTLFDAALAVTLGAARSIAIDLVALHVHHGLSPHADDWLRHCADTCARRGVPFSFSRVTVARRARTSVEAEARSARYGALAALAHEAGAAAVLLAQHADDQAETLLLQLARGAGPRGLAAMPEARFDDGLWWLRPFLGLPRVALESYARRRALCWVDDESNRDLRLRRNALRSEVIPALARIAPGYPLTLVRAARHQAETAALLDELAGLDAGEDRDELACASLRHLSAPRARNLLRWYLRRKGLPAPSAARLDELLRQVSGARDDACFEFAQGSVRFGIRRGRLSIHRAPPAPYLLAWTGSNEVALTHGTLAFVPTIGLGIAKNRIAGARVTIRSGTPGERFCRAGCSSQESVAELLRRAGVARWDRLGIPRVYCDDTLVALPGAGVSATHAAAADEPAFALEWRPATDQGGSA